MNVFRLAGDLAHVFAIIILLLKIWKTRSCAGISGKSQVLFALVYLTRYLDLFTTYVSLYNSVMKVIFLASSGATVYLMYVKFKATYDHNHDSFRVEFLFVPCVLLSLLINHDFTVMEVLWTFSIYLESVAILPQLFMVIFGIHIKTAAGDFLFTRTWHSYDFSLDLSDMEPEQTKPKGYVLFIEQVMLTETYKSKIICNCPALWGRQSVVSVSLSSKNFREPTSKTIARAAKHKCNSKYRPIEKKDGPDKSTEIPPIINLL
uniref:ER lumen protein-retaining receptor n=1 Tax=Glossina pallidipes TaxID=7398 RepID=A0A1B0AA39_GLOPL